MQIKKNTWKYLATLMGPLNGIRYLEFRIIKRWLSPKEGDNILDLACGAGALTHTISKTGSYVVGIDLSKSSASMFKLLNGPRTPMILASAEHLPIKNNVFHKVVCNTALQLFKNDQKALEEISRVLKGDGTAVLTVDSLSHPKVTERFKKKHQTNDQVFNYYTHSKLKDKVEKSGLMMNKYRYYLKSGLGANLFNFGIKMNWSFSWRISSLFFYPILVISEDYTTHNSYGYGLATLIKKSNNHEEHSNNSR